MAELISMRKAYAEALVELGAANPDVVALTADVGTSDFTYLFEQRFPDRYFNAGIAEPCMVDVAAGLALGGKVPFANTFAFLFALRAVEQVRTRLGQRGNIRRVSPVPCRVRVERTCRARTGAPGGSRDAEAPTR